MFLPLDFLLSCTPNGTPVAALLRSWTIFGVGKVLYNKRYPFASAHDILDVITKLTPLVFHSLSTVTSFPSLFGGGVVMSDDNCGQPKNGQQDAHLLLPFRSASRKRRKAMRARKGPLYVEQ